MDRRGLVGLSSDPEDRQQSRGSTTTIDNDLVGSDMTIGVDTALNIAIEAIDRLKTGTARPPAMSTQACLEVPLASSSPYVFTVCATGCPPRPSRRTPPPAVREH